MPRNPLEKSKMRRRSILKAREARRSAGLSSWEKAGGRGSIGGPPRAPEEGCPVPVEEGIGGQAIPLHDGRSRRANAGSPYVEIDVRVASAAIRKGPFPT